jgi:hypothetical protein
MTLRTTAFAAAAAAFTVAGVANAGILNTYVGYSASQNVTGSAYATAQSAFTGLGLTGVESFENHALGTFPGDLVFTGTGVTADFVQLSGDDQFRELPRVLDADPESQNSRTPTDGSNFLYTGVNPNDAATLSLDFQPDGQVLGFGFSITDLGDFGATITMTLTDGSTDTLVIAPGQNGLPTSFVNGSRIWASFTTDVAIDDLEISLTGGGGGDNFSFDEFTVLVVPVPPAVAMAGLGLAGVAWRRRRMIGG